MLSYSYLGISNGAWDVHLKKVLDTGRKKVNQLHSNNNSPTSDILLLISNRDIPITRLVHEWYPYC